MTLRQAFRRTFLLIALALLLIAAAHAATTALFVLRSQRTSGIVVGYRVVEGASPPFVADDGRLYYAVVEFEDLHGVSQRLTSPRGRRSRPVAEGTEIEVLWIPGRGTTARIDSTMDLWGAALIFGGLGLLFLLIAVAAPAGFRRPRSQSAPTGRLHRG